MEPTNLYAALDVTSGQVISSMTARRRAQEFLRFLKLVDVSVPEHLAVHVVLDNSSAHKTPTVKRWLLRHPALRSARHTDVQLLAKPGRALVRRAHHQVAAARHPPLGPRVRRLDPHLDHELERRSQSVCLAQDRRRDPRQPRNRLSANRWLRTLARRLHRALRGVPGNGLSAPGAYPVSNGVSAATTAPVRFRLSRRPAPRDRPGRADRRSHAPRR